VINLLKETLDTLAECNKTSADVLFVCCDQYDRPAISFSWDEFAEIADFLYDNGYGGNEIHSSLKIVGDNWWLERGEYDGSEWWEFKTMPEHPPYQKPCKADLEQ